MLVLQWMTFALNLLVFNSLSSVLDGGSIVKVKYDIGIAILKLHVIFCRQKALSIYSGDNIYFQLNLKIEIENKGENYRRCI